MDYTIHNDFDTFPEGEGLGYWIDKTCQDPRLPERLDIHLVKSWNENSERIIRMIYNQCDDPEDAICIEPVFDDANLIGFNAVFNVYAVVSPRAMLIGPGGGILGNAERDKDTARWLQTEKLPDGRIKVVRRFMDNELFVLYQRLEGRQDLPSPNTSTQRDMVGKLWC